MSKAYKVVLILAVLGGAIAFAFNYLRGLNFQALNPKGTIASKEQGLIVFTVLLSLVVVVPVFAMLAVIVVRYREGNEKAKYTPDWDHSRFFEGLWWGIPCLIIIVLAVVTWTSTHELDPTKPIASSTKPINVQVVALQWKWLFIYPDEHIATINALEFPVNTPINFQLTADAPMNSFWIPSLGGQIYAMPGMTTQLHLMATSRGSYNGSSANISGVGFSSMRFTAKATSSQEYTNWKKSLQHSSPLLTDAQYIRLAKPTGDASKAYYTLSDDYLYDKIVMKYMTPSDSVTSQKQE